MEDIKNTPAPETDAAAPPQPASAPPALKKPVPEPLIKAARAGDQINISVRNKQVDRISVVLNGALVTKLFLHNDTSRQDIAIPLSAPKPDSVLQVIVTHTNNEQTVLHATL